jgi:hypothetical protein
MIVEITKNSGECIKRKNAQSEFNISMRFLNWVIAAYLLALFLLLHTTLLYCGESHCVYPLESPPVSPEVGFQLRRAISVLLPFELKMMQKWTQWLVVG